MTLPACEAVFSIILLHKGHDVDAETAERRADGGAGVALPAGSYGFYDTSDFLCHNQLLNACDRLRRAATQPVDQSTSRVTHREIKLDRRLAAEERDQHTHAAALVIDRIDDALEIGGRGHRS